MRYCLVLLLLSFVASAQSQVYRPEKVNQKAIKSYNKAMGYLSQDAFREAIPLLQSSIATDSNYVDAYLSLAGIFGELKNYNEATHYYEVARAKDANYFARYYLSYSINLAGMGRFEDALAAINLFLYLPNLDDVSIRSGFYRKKSYEFALDYKAKHPDKDYVFNPINLGDSVNSTRHEYLPTLSVDDSLLVFSRRNETGGEDFYRSKMMDPIHFTNAEKIPGDLNLETYKGAITVSEDGDWMIFAGDISGKTFGNYDLYISYYTPKGWSEPENLGPDVNSEFWESTPCLSPDNRALYFSSKREGGYGGADLYVSYRDVRGKWGPAINMGPTINTRGNEQAPFVHADNQTFYYTSDGLPGYGGSDLFIVRKDSSSKWGAPENLGYPINTIENDGSMMVAPNGIDAYYASDRSDTRGGLDLYHFELRADIRPFKTVFIKGYVYDNKTKKGLPCNVELIDNSTGKPLMLVQTDETGFYFITLPTGRDFTFNVNRRGYLFYSKVYSLTDKSPDSTYHENIYLQPIEVNTSMVLQHILFETKDYKLKESSKVELDKVVQILADNPSLHVAINGHTDNVGSNADNLLLSTNRAKAVTTYFIEKGIAADRLQYKGFGAAKPIASNDTEEGRAMNRRTELSVVSY